MEKEKATYVTVYQLVFFDDHNNGFGFQCDANGNVTEFASEQVKKNYERCVAEGDRFKREVQKYVLQI